MENYIWIYFFVFVATTLFTSAPAQPLDADQPLDDPSFITFPEPPNWEESENGNGWTFPETKHKDVMTCSVDYRKVGCYHDSVMQNMKMILSHRDGKEGEQLDWDKFAVSVHSLICKCQKKARAKGLNLISIRFWAECWASKISETEISQINKKVRAAPAQCVNKHFKQCKDKDMVECVGKKNHGYAYLYIPEVPTTMPLPTWSEWPEWPKCATNCGTERMGIRRLRSCSIPHSCPGEDYQEKPCPVQECAKAKWSEWDPWPKCGSLIGGCGRFQYRRYRICKGVGSCPGENWEKMSCVVKCESITEPPYPWSGWTACSKSCGSGTRRKTAYCTEDVPLYDYILTCENNTIAHFASTCNRGKCPAS